LPQYEAEGLQEIVSGSALLMADSSSADLLKELNTKRNKVRLWPIALTVTVLAILITMTADAPNWVSVLVAIAGLASTVAGGVFDQMSKTVVLFYNLDSEAAEKYQKLHDTFDRLSQCERKWRIEAKGSTLDWKRNAGARSLVRRRTVRLLKTQPPYVKTNISVPTIPLGRQTLFFFPDRLLVFESKAVGAVGYDSLALEIDRSNFIEDEGVPSDSAVVGSTWRFVNKSGGPDRRFNNNRQIPIVTYEYAHFTSPTGLNELVSLSKTGVSESFRQAIRELGAAANRKDRPPRRLRVLSDSADTQVVELTLPHITIGSAEDNIIQVENPSVSRHHAVVIVEQTSCKVRDLQSTNGTLVNGRAVSEAYLNNGDTVEIGPIRLRYESLR
jgi:hypothetical protein